MVTSYQKSSKWVHSFQQGKADGSAQEKSLLGGKGANLAEMCNLDLPVPPGFTISTQVCDYFYKNQNQYPETLTNQLNTALASLEEQMGHKFGDVNDPLLVSVRSGAPISMPGMMDTVLNLGLNDETIEGLAKQAGSKRFALDSYRRFIQMYGDVVMNVPHQLFEDALHRLKERVGEDRDNKLLAEHWEELIPEYKEIIKTVAGTEFPQDPHKQLWGSISAVFSSWMCKRAITYRQINNIADDLGTAVNVQCMVFGNRGDASATGVLFTRNPNTGEKELYGEFLHNAQGEDVVAGIRTPFNINDREAGQPLIDKEMPGMYNQILEVSSRLEEHYRDMQDIEFTIQQGKLFLLQTRGGKRTTGAALKIAVDMAEEGLLTREEALLAIEPTSLNQLLHPTIDYATEFDILTTGLAASPGAASGIVALTADEAERLANDGEDVILVRESTSPEDIHGMHAARGILTAAGGMTSHAAVVARGMGRSCVCGASELQIDDENNQITIGETTVKVGERITLDGSTGHVIAGEVQMAQPTITREFDIFLKWADSERTLGIRANAETPADCKTARKYGAEGIGLCRTEHMFFDPDRINVMRQMILAETVNERLAALNKLQPIQRGDFVEIFSIMKGLPITIRLLDPPLHEFLPHSDEDVKQVAKEAGVSEEKVRRRMHQLHEENPMLGHRGCRLGISYPEIYEMQVSAMLEAALEVQSKNPALAPKLEIMVPFVANETEIELWKKRIDDLAAEKLAELGNVKVNFQVGTMMELPRACLTANEIVPHVEFFSFGTNDLTQTAIGLSRDDTSAMLSDYLTTGLISTDPFQSIDRVGVGELVKIAVERGRAEKKDLKCGVCGEHGGDPQSIEFFHNVGLDYVSCSPFRVPVARLAAAQAAIRDQSMKVSVISVGKTATGK